MTIDAPASQAARISVGVKAPITVGGHEVPAGATIGTSITLMHRRADLYPDPHRFDPDRWDPARKPARHAFVPFSNGARKCIGDKFSLMEATLALASIVARWRLAHLPGEEEVRPAAAAVIRPKRLRMRVSHRSVG